jgi:hypothetical protein
MNAERRDVLKVLTVLGVGGAGSALLLSGDGDERPAGSERRTDSTDAPTATVGDANGYAAAVERASADLGGTPPLPSVQPFDYEPVDVTFDDRWVARFVARPTDGADGDRLRVTPGTQSAEELTATVHNWLGLPDERWVETTLAGETVALHGGKVRDRVAVVGTLDERDLVVGARAVDGVALESVVAEWTIEG